MSDTKKKSFGDWASHSLIGHVVSSQVYFSLPLLILFLGTEYSDGTLSSISALYALFISSLAGLVFAILFWYTVSLPLIKRRKKNP